MAGHGLPVQTAGAGRRPIRVTMSVLSQARSSSGLLPPLLLCRAGPHCSSAQEGDAGHLQPGKGLCASQRGYGQAAEPQLHAPEGGGLQAQCPPWSQASCPMDSSGHMPLLVPLRGWQMSHQASWAMVTSAKVTLGLKREECFVSVFGGHNSCKISRTTLSVGFRPLLS